MSARVHVSVEGLSKMARKQLSWIGSEIGIAENYMTAPGRSYRGSHLQRYEGYVRIRYRSGTPCT